MLRWYLVCMCYLLGCKQGSEAPAEPATPPVTVNVEAPSPPTPPAPLPKNIKREILVGGCLDTCQAPEPALKAFLRAVLGGQGIQSVKPYINSAILVHNGQQYGARWAQLFMENKLGERNQDIEKWLATWLSWVDHIVDPADRSKPEAGITIVEKNQKRLVVQYRHPEVRQTASRPTAAEWRLVFKPRGLEWLLAEIEDRPITRR